MSLSKLYHFHGKEDGDGHFMDAMVIVLGNWPSRHTFRIYGETFTLQDGVCKGNTHLYVLRKSWLDCCGTDSVYITLVDSPSEVKAHATLVDTNGMDSFKKWLDDNRPEYCDWEIIPIYPPRICDDESRICHLDGTTIASYTPPCVQAVPCDEKVNCDDTVPRDASAPVAVAPPSVSALHDDSSDSDSSDSDSSDDDVDSDHNVPSPPVEQTSSTTQSPNWWNLFCTDIMDRIYSAVGPSNT